MSYSNNNNPEASAAGAVIVMLLAVAATIIALLPIVYPLAGAILLVIAGIAFAVVALGIEIFFKNIDSQTVITIAGIFTFIVVTVMAYPVVKAAEYSVSANPIYRRFRLLWRVIVAPSVSIGLVVIFKDSMGLSDAAIVLAPSVALILTLVFSLVPSCSIERLVEENA